MKNISRNISIGFENLRVDCIVGILPHEQTFPQPLFIDIHAQVESLQEQENGIPQVDYTVLAEECRTIIRQKPHGLIENLAIEIAHVLWERFSLSSLKIRIRKPRALLSADYAYAEYFMEKKERPLASD